MLLHIDFHKHVPLSEYVWLDPTEDYELWSSVHVTVCQRFPVFLFWCGHASNHISSLNTLRRVFILACCRIERCIFVKDQLIILVGHFPKQPFVVLMHPLW